MKWRQIGTQKVRISCKKWYTFSTHLQHFSKISLLATLVNPSILHLLAYGRAGHRGGVLDPQEVHGDETYQGENSELDK